MAHRLAHQLALIATVIVLGRSIWNRTSVAETVELALSIGVICWMAGYVVAVVLNRLATEHVAALAGRTAEVAEQDPISPDRISAREMNN